MHPFRLLPSLVALVAVLSACRDDGLSTPPPRVAPHFERDLPGEGGRGITVMTRNLYVGGNVDLVIEAANTDPNSVPLVVAAVFQQVQHADFHVRAEGIADEIARNRPHVVGLQELSLIRIQTPGDFQPFNAADTVIDFLSVLQAAIAARGLQYTAYTVPETDVEVPMLTGFDPSTGPTFSDVRLNDYDALLVRADLAVANVASANYANLAPLFGPLPLLRGWVAADVTVGRTTFRVLSTHLEASNPAFSGPQAGELVTLLAGVRLPVVLLGDFNSGPGDDETAYHTLTGAGFADVWTAGRSRGPGLTCCSNSDLDSPTTDGVYDKRIDLVLVRDRQRHGRFDRHDRDEFLKDAQIAVVGEEPRERLLAPGGYLLWPSDHAGVVATLRLP
jgi:endonuclease/exonuclease/phosphatase family metal-dependent hydrolase